MIKSYRLTQISLAHLVGQLTGMCQGGDVWEVIVKPWKDTRSLAANRKMWACLGDVSKQVQRHVNGVMAWITPEDWKDVFTVSLAHQSRITPGLDGGFVQLGTKTRNMKVQEMCDLIEVIYVFGASNNVKWSEPIPAEYEEFARYEGKSCT